MFNGVAVVTASAPAKGAYHFVIIPGQERSKKALPIRAGLKIFCPKPPNTCFENIANILPKTGIHKNNFSFYQAIKPGLDYAVMDDVTNFQHFAGLRKHLESAYFVEAAQSLSLAELNSLENLVQSALTKIEGSPIQLPNEEHRDFHMKIFANIENPFLQGLLETYWDLYHFHDFEYYPDHDYLLRVWHYHMRIIEQVKNRNFTQALALLIEHMDLLKQREKVVPRLSFE